MSPTSRPRSLRRGGAAHTAPRGRPSGGSIRATEIGGRRRASVLLRDPVANVINNDPVLLLLLKYQITAPAVIESTCRLVVDDGLCPVLGERRQTHSQNHTGWEFFGEGSPIDAIKEWAPCRGRPDHRISRAEASLGRQLNVVNDADSSIPLSERLEQTRFPSRCREAMKLTRGQRVRENHQLAATAQLHAKLRDQSSPDIGVCCGLRRSTEPSEKHA